ncbi:MAG: leucine-rich repeat protein [Bacteroidales bacterium]|nr:leucine-rich repeat protein [Bacteroidales bacterium]
MKKILLVLCISVLCVISHAQEKKLRVAVLDPTTSGIAMDGGTKLAVQELISSAFVSTGKFIIIERSMIDKIIKEQAFQNSDVADNSQATEIGKLAGANKVVLSAVSLVGGRNMLSIKIIDVMTASIDQQKTKIVGTNDLLDVVEPLTMELLGEEAIYVKQNTILAQTESEQLQQQAQPQTTTKKKNASTSKTSNYDKENAELCKQISAGITAAKIATNPKLEKLIATGKIKPKITIGTGLNAEINAAGVLQISGEGMMSVADVKALAPYRPFVTTIVIDEGITKVSAFTDFAMVQYVLLPNSLQVLDDGCFKGCSKLIAINIPPKVTKISNETFRDCRSLTSILLANSVEHIGAYAFAECVGIPRLFIPDNVTTLGKGAFKSMKGLSEVYLSNKITVIPDETFANCKSFIKFTCPENIKNVGNSAFANCQQLVQITFLSEDVLKIGNECFDDCENLGNVIFHCQTPPVCADDDFDDIFDDDAVTTISVPVESVAIYKANKFWKQCKTIVSFSK